MKKLLSVITGLIASSALYALPVLNPAAPALLTDGAFMCGEEGCWGIKFGYRGDFVFDRHLKTRSLVSPVAPFGSNNVRQRYELYANEGVLTLNLWNLVDVYGFVGAANTRAEGFVPGVIPVNPVIAVTTADVVQRTCSNTIWGVGIKAVLWDYCWGNCGTTYLGVDGQYESFRPRTPRGVIENAQPLVFLAGSNGRIRYQEAQGSIGIAHRICNLVPYVAVKYSRARVRNYGPISVLSPFDGVTALPVLDTTIASRVSSNQRVGYVVGTSLVDANRMSVTAEARFIDEKALSIAADIRF